MSIVLVGNFNPVIFQPAWLAANGLVPPEEAKDPKVQVIHPDLASFTADWVNLQVVPTRFQALTADAARYEPLKDLVMGIFALLEHAPFTQMGINCDAHYEASQEVRDRIGDALAPKSPWASTMQDPKLWALVVAGKPNDGEAQKFQVTVKPSESIRLGINIQTNRHYERAGADAPRLLLECLAKEWTNAQLEARTTAQSLLRAGAA